MSPSSSSQYRPEAGSSGEAFVAATQVRYLTLKFSDLASAKKVRGREKTTKRKAELRE